MKKPSYKIEFFVWKIFVTEQKDRNRFGAALYNLVLFPQQNDPLKLVVLGPVGVLITQGLTWVNEPQHHPSDGTDSGTKVQRHVERDNGR
jgi:hypothetical protein